MEYNRNYGQSQYGYYDEPPKKGGGAFAAVVIVISLLLLAALAIGLFISAVQRQAELLQATPTPVPATTWSPSAWPGQVIPDVPEQTAPPTATPVPATTTMPKLDGVAPNIPILMDNPIPDIYEAVGHGVVGVLNYATTTNPYGRSAMEIYGSGSGFIVSSEGYVLTNAHVVDGAEKLSVLLVDGTEIDAAIVGSDLETDIAVLRIEHDGLRPIACGDSDLVRVGEYALAIGNPLDTSQLANTITLGIISAKEREITIDGYTNIYLQTDAAINFGNSGGPLLNLQGQVIGMNSAKSVTAGYDELGNAVAAEGIGFALPINHVLDIVERLITEGPIRRPAVGINVTTVTQAISELEGVPTGVRVEGVVRGGPGAKAGLKAGDIIVDANGKTISENSELTRLIADSRIGDAVALHVYRAGEYLDLTVILGEKGNMDFQDTSEPDTANP